MGMDKKTAVKRLVIAFSCLFLLTGCYDSREIEERAIVLAIGIDQINEDEVAVTVQIPIPMNIAGGSTGSGGGSEGESVKIISTTGRTFFEALERLRYQMSEKMFFGQTMILAVNKKLAKHGLENVLDALRRMPQIRRLLYPIVIEEGSAAQFLKVKTDMEKVPAVYIDRMITSEKRLDYVSDYTLGHFYDDLYHKAKQPTMLTMKVKGDNKITITGIAPFRGTHLAGMLGERDMVNVLRFGKGKVGGGMTFSVKGGDDIASFSPENVDTSYSYSLKNGKVHANIDVFIEGELREITFPYDLSKTEKLEDGFERVLREQSLATVRKLQAYNTDIIDLGARLRSFHYDMWKQVDWEKAFPEAKVNIDYEVKIRRTGSEMHNIRQKTD